MISPSMTSGTYLLDTGIVASLFRGDTGIRDKIKTALRAKGRPIPETDIWIAAAAMQHELSFAMRDPHFEQVEGLTLASR